jgi:hypothetical protein
MMDDIDRTTDWYYAALKGDRGPIDADNPRAGYYRAKSRDGTLSAVAIWYDSFTGDLRYQDNGRDVDDMKARERWPYVSKTPISEALFWQFRDTGLWGDIDATIQGAVITGVTIHDDGRPAAVKVEIPPEKQIAAKIAEAKAAVPQYLKIESDEAATRAQSLRSTLTGLKGEAKKAYDALNRPLLDEQKFIRAIWNPIMDDAESSSIQLRTALEDWELAKRKAAIAAEQAGVKPNMPAPAAKISGGMGRAATAKDYPFVETIDIDKVFAQFKSDDRLISLLSNIAQEAVNAGISVPGATIVMKVRIR